MSQALAPDTTKVAKLLDEARQKARSQPKPTSTPQKTTSSDAGQADKEAKPRRADKNPALRLPGDNRPLGEFASEVGRLLRSQNIFARKGCAFTLDAEGQKLEPATATWLRSWAEKFVICFKVKLEPGGKRTTPVATMTEDAARVVLVAPQFLENLRQVERFHPCRMPVIRADGRLELLPEGHDAESATFTAAGSDYDLMMSEAEAKATLEEAFAEFPFADDGGRSKAVAVAALFTVYAAGLMPQGANRPVFLYLGNAEGTGKTTAARLAGVPYGAVGVECAPATEEEWQKKLLSSVIGGRRLLVLDNLKGFLNSPSLEAYTTASQFGGRILGVSKEFIGEACATVLITGNRLTISPDMRRRSLVVELFMHELRAEDRKFARCLDDPALLALRPRLLAACWTMVRLWDAGGRPKASRNSTSFPRWCDTIGGLVEYSGFACPTAPPELDGIGDTDTADIANLAKRMPVGRGHGFAEVVGLCDEAGLFERFTGQCDPDNHGDLPRKERTAFSRLLKGYHQRVVAPGLMFCIVGEGRARRYVVTDAAA